MFCIETKHSLYKFEEGIWLSVQGKVVEAHDQNYNINKVDESDE